MNLNTIITGDSLEVLRSMADESVAMCVTSPPYYGLRNYGVDGQIGLVLLVGIMAKNGILIVEFANQLRDRRGYGSFRFSAQAGANRQSDDQQRDDRAHTVSHPHTSISPS